MLKAKEFKIEDSNIANLGSDLEKKVREEAAKGEPAWDGAGVSPGLQIWRIEKFKVVAVPKETYGQFYSGDSYILMHTYKKRPDSDALAWDIHFWLGKHTTQDEAGTAAYKTVELDDRLGGAPVQHREVQGHESQLFLGYFKNTIRILEGGVDSGFRHVEPTKYEPRLLWLKGKRKIRITQVEMSAKSLNSGDVFVLDAGLDIFQWNGSKAGPQEKFKGATFCRALDDERAGKAQVHVTEEGSKSPDAQEFWKRLGGSEADIKTAEEGGNDVEAEKSGNSTKKLFQLSDASGQLTFKEVASGLNIKRSLLDSNDVMILDAGHEIFAWIGKGASVQERKKSMQFAQDYLTKNSRPSYLPISRILEGGENETFENFFSH